MTDDQILDRTLDLERGYQCDPDDTGNRNAYGQLVGTNWGITPETYTRFYGRIPSAEDMGALTPNDAREIYRLFYLQPFDLIVDADLKQELVDFGVNCGVPTAIRALQQAVGTVVDGRIGPKTIAALTSADRNRVDRDLTRLRIERSVDAIIARPAKRRFLTGWLRRILLVD